MPKPVPVISAMTVNRPEIVGLSVHLDTDAGEMDVTVTTDQYASIRAQLADTGRATIPTRSAA